MRLTTVGYYADFAIGLALIAWLAGMEVLADGSLFHAIIWLNYVAMGFAVWTLVEYGVHRLIYHHVPFFERMHDAHHAEPNAFIGAPPVLGPVLILLMVYVPAHAVNPSIGNGVTSGVVGGYLAYMLVHHAVHHWNLSTTSWLYGTRHHHALHHHHSEVANFGVTTAFWDHVFGTAVTPKLRFPGQSEPH